MYDFPVVQRLAVLGTVGLSASCTSDLRTTLDSLRQDPDAGEQDSGSIAVDSGSASVQSDPADSGASSANDASLVDSGPDAGGDAGIGLCGNLQLEPGEECDDGLSSSECDPDCTFASCGDGLRNSVAGEQCDDGGQSSQCTADCTRFVCPDDCDCLFAEGRAYFVCDEVLDFNSASARCEELGAELATIETEAEQAFLLANTGNLQLALGGRYSDDGMWVWPSGQSFWTGRLEGEAVPGVYSTWDSGQPSANTSATCMLLSAFRPTGPWRAYGCGGRAYLCEKGGEVAETCGNDQVEPGEFCDTVVETAECDLDCTPPVCGDGVVNLAAGEGCDDNNVADLDACDAECEPTGLVSHWPLDEERGQRARDRISFAHLEPMNLDFDATSPGHVLLNGEDQWLELGQEVSPPDLSGISEITFSGKVQFVGLPESETSAQDAGAAGADGLDGIRPIVVLGSLDEGAMAGLWLNGSLLEGGAQQSADAGVDVEARSFDVSSWFDDDVWHHVALTYDSTGWHLFFDGNLVDSSEAEPVASAAPSSFASGAWSIGGFTGGGGEHFAGGLRDIRIYDRALDEDVLRALLLAL